MLAWERRLRDLANLLKNCGETYFTPDLFRQNTNQFLQTSRTVTFIVQKNKTSIPDYDTWYKTNVVAPWGNDNVMLWARDARNVIEKEGDLVMFSYLSTTVIFSHLPEQDVVVETPRPFVVQADIDKIAKLAEASLPPGVLDAAVLQIERRWVANSLPDHELISALTYIYSTIFRMCFDLAKHLGAELDDSIPHPTDLDPVSNDVAITRFIKLGKPSIGRMKSIRVNRDPNFEAPIGLSTLTGDLASLPEANCIDDLVERAEKMAEFTFSRFGNHVPMLFLFDQNWKPVDFMTTAFVDQADKFLFWRNAAKRAAYLRATAFVWISETWLRDYDKRFQIPIRKMKIIGEQLQLVAGSIVSTTKMTQWTIVRTENPAAVKLERLHADGADEEKAKVFFVEPLLSAMRSVRVNPAKT
jgi:hypothetical protein